jgi:hypothetical protein
MGIEAAPDGSGRFRLTITITGDEAQCELYDNGRGTSVFRRNITLASLSKKDIAAFAEALGDAVFTGY